MFRKEINPFSVSDRVRFRNIDRTLDLEVKAQASSIVLGIKRAQDRLSLMNDQSSNEDS